MPDPKGLLTSEEKERILKWMREQERGDIVCPVCKSVEWLVADHLVQPVTLGANGGLILGGLGYPQVMLVSQPCGYTILMNAVVMGLLPATPIKEGETTAEPPQTEKANG